VHLLGRDEAEAGDPPRRGRRGHVSREWSISRDPEFQIRQQVPRREEVRDALLGRQSTDEHEPIAGAHPGRSIANEVRPDVHSVPRQAATYEDVRRPLAVHEIGVHIRRPGPAGSVDHEHRCHRGRGGTRVAITGVDNRRQRRGSDAVSAFPSVAEQGGRGAHEPEVVDRLHDRHAGLAACPVDGRRQPRKRVVDVDDVRLELVDRAPDEMSATRGPDRLGGQAERGSGTLTVFDLPIVDDQPPHSMAPAREERGFGGEHRLLASALPVGVVNEEDGRTGSTHDDAAEA